MSKRSTRKTRHYKETLTFKQYMLLGQVRNDYLRGDITYDEIPDWIKSSVLAASLIPVPVKPAEPEEETIILTSNAIVNESEHVHGPSCHH